MDIEKRLTLLETRLEGKEKQIDRLESAVGVNADEIDELKTNRIEQRTRLDNGRKVFEQHDKRIDAVEQRTTPQPPSILKIVSVTLSVFIVLSGALWALSERLADRPTVKQLEVVLRQFAEHHESVGHKQVRDDVRSIQFEQGKARHLIETVQKTQTVHGEQLKQVLDRLPTARRRNRR